jgi:hypothetical protein
MALDRVLSSGFAPPLLPEVATRLDSRRANAVLVVGATLVATTLFLSGLGIAAAADFTRDYLGRPIALAVFGIVWIYGWYLWGVSGVIRMLRHSRTAFACSDEEFTEFVEDWRSRARRVPLRSSLVASVVLSLYVVGMTHSGHRIVGMPWFSEPWISEPHLAAKNAIVVLWLFPLAFGIGAGIAGVWKYVRLLRALLVANPPGVGERSPPRSPLIESLPVARQGLAALASFAVTVGLAWTIGLIAWIVVTSPGTFDWAETVAVAVLAVIGFLLVLVPQWLVHRALQTRRDELLRHFARSLRDYLDGRSHARRVDRLRHPNARELDEMIRNVRAEPTWANVTSVTGPVLIGQLVLPALSLVVTILVRTD